MANEVKIKLTADGKQVRQELKLIERDIQDLSSEPVTGKSNSQQGKRSSSNKPDGTTSTQSSGDKLKQETRDKVNNQSLREMTLIRKELQRLNGSNGTGGNPFGGGNGGGGQPPQLPGPTGNGSGGNGGAGGGGKLTDALGKLVTAATALKMVTAAYRSLQNSARSAQTGASLAFTTYGTTMAYDDFSEARKEASLIGKSYGYDSTVTMNAAEANMSTGGFTTIENQNADMDALLRSSKYLGLDPNTLASASGRMTAMGAFASGDQQRFANILAQSIVDANMYGREDEQLRVLEDIADTLGSVNTSVSEASMTNSLQLYNALVNQNENLRGQRGSGLVNDLNSFATSGNTSLMQMLGYGTTYTGVEGLQELRRQIEADPTKAITDAYQNFMSTTGSYMDEDRAKAYFKEFILNNTGMSQLEVDDIVDSIGASSESMNKYYDTTEGEKLVEDIGESYENDKLSTEERYDVEKTENSDDRGDTWNWVKHPFQSLYNLLPDWAQQGADVASGAMPYVGGAVGLNALKHGFSNWKTTGSPFKSGTGGGWWKDFWGKGGGAVDDVVNAGTGAADDVFVDLVEGADGVWREAGSSVDDVVSGASNSADDVLALTDDIIGNTGDDLVNAATNSIDDIVGAASSTLDDLAAGVSGAIDDAVAQGADDLVNAAANSVDDIVANSADDVLSSVLGNGAKNVFGKALGPLIQLGFGAYNYAKADSDYEKDEAVGETAGGMIGGVLGSFLGPVGGILGGWAGGELGGAIANETTNAEANYGTKWAAGWNPFAGIWRKNGTIAEQKLHGTYDYSNEEIEVRNPDGTTTTSTVGEVERQNAINTQQWSLDNKDDIEAFQQQMLSNTDENGNVDLSWLKGADMATVNTLLNASFGTNKLTGLQYLLGSDQTMADVEFGSNEQENYERQIEALIQSMDENSTSVDNLTTLFQTGASNNAAAAEEAENGGSGSVWYKPWTWFSHATGNDYVPYDNYTALLHRGEMVLNAHEADDYRQGKVGGTDGASHATGIDININLSGAVDGITAENQERIIQAVVQQIAASGIQSVISNGFTRVQNR